MTLYKYCIIHPFLSYHRLSCLEAWIQWTWLLNPPMWTTKSFVLTSNTTFLFFLRKAYCERLRLVMTRNIGKVGLLFKAYYADAVKRTANGVAENHSAVSANHSAVSANHSAGSAIPEKNGDRGGLVITLSWSFPHRYLFQRWHTNKRWTIHFCCCCFSSWLWVAEPDSALHFTTNPDPHQGDGNLRPLRCRPSRTLWASIVSVHGPFLSPELLNFESYVDPDPAFHSNAGPDPQPWLRIRNLISGCPGTSV